MVCVDGVSSEAVQLPSLLLACVTAPTSTFSIAVGVAFTLLVGA